MRDLRGFLPEFALELLAAADGAVFRAGGLTEARRRELREAWDWLGAELAARHPPGSKLDSAFAGLPPRSDAGHLLRLLKGMSPRPVSGFRWVTSGGTVHVGGTWSDLPNDGELVVIDKRALLVADASGAAAAR